MGTFLSLDLFLFFVMFEVTLVPGYFIVAGYGGLRRNYAAMKFFIYTFAGSAFLFVAILALVLLTRPPTAGTRPSTSSPWPGWPASYRTPIRCSSSPGSRSPSR